MLEVTTIQEALIYGYVRGYEAGVKPDERT